MFCERFGGEWRHTSQIFLGNKELDVIPGDEFYHALLRLWIGEPLQKSIKEGLLGTGKV